MPRPRTGTTVLCEPAQSKCTWTSHKHARISRKNAGEQMEHPDLTPALTPTVRTPQCGHAVWGTINAYDHIFNQEGREGRKEGRGLV